MESSDVKILSVSGAYPHYNTFQPMMKINVDIDVPLLPTMTDFSDASYDAFANALGRSIIDAFIAHRKNSDNTTP